MVASDLLNSALSETSHPKLQRFWIKRQLLNRLKDQLNSDVR